MASKRQILFGLLRFGAADPQEKTSIVESYLQLCQAPKGSPHVWNPDVEIVESLWRYPCQFAESAEEEKICSEIERVADSLLENQAAIVDRSAFMGQLGLELQEKCVQALTICGPDKEAPLSFFDLMCHTCD